MSTEYKNIEPLKYNNNSYIKKLSDDINADDINQFNINFNLRTLISFNNALIHRKNNNNTFTLVLNTTISAFDNFIATPDIHSFYKDVIGVKAVFNKKKVRNYAPRMHFKFIKEQYVVYDNKGDSKLQKNVNIINIIKLSNEILAATYNTDKSLLTAILNNIIDLFDIQGGNKYIIAKLIIHIMEQNSFVQFINLVLMLSNNNIGISNRILTTIRKVKHIYVIKITNKLINNNTGTLYDNNFKLTYIINERDPRIMIKIDITDIDGLIKSYPNFPSLVKNNRQSITHNINTDPIIVKNKVNFVSYQ